MKKIVDVYLMLIIYYMTFVSLFVGVYFIKEMLWFGLLNLIPFITIMCLAIYNDIIKPRLNKKENVIEMYIILDELVAPIANVSKNKGYLVVGHTESYVFIINDNGKEVGIAYGAVKFI